MSQPKMDWPSSYVFKYKYICVNDLYNIFVVCFFSLVANAAAAVCVDPFIINFELSCLMFVRMKYKTIHTFAV